MRLDDSRMRFFGGRDGDPPTTIQSGRYIRTLEAMAEQWSRSHDALTFRPIGTPDWDTDPRPAPVRRLRYRDGRPRNQYRWG